jgi:hypothetical protein
MREKGEATLLAALMLLALTGIFILCSLELQHSFYQMKLRTNLFLCLKETKGELNRYLKFMGQSNWAIQNLNRTQMIMLMIPGLQGGAFNAAKIKKTLQAMQDLSLVAYLKTLKDLKQKGCSLDPQLIINPFEVSFRGFQRDAAGAAKLRNKKWTYFFVSHPYTVKLEVDASQMINIKPMIRYQSRESEVKWSSLSFSL